jgi:hypothetical protein
MEYDYAVTQKFLEGPRDIILCDNYKSVGHSSVMGIT